MEQPKNNNFKNWYIGERHLFKKLANKVESIIFELLEENNLDIHAIHSRVKDIESSNKKASKKSYSNPEKEMHDLAGIRVITYVESDLEKVSEIIKKTFQIDLKNSINKKDELGTDKVGYQSVHYVAQLKQDRLKLPEYRKFKGLKFEIQIRTILQHAWAEIEHDRNYKFSGQLPPEIKRRFTVLAGSLELADREFNSIASAIDKISRDVLVASKIGNLNIPINSTTLNSYLEDKLKGLIENHQIEGFLSIAEENEVIVINHLLKFKVTTLDKLDEILSQKYITAFEEFMINIANYHLLISNALLFKFHDLFFNKIDQDFYSFVDETEILLQKKLGVPIEKIAIKHKIPFAKTKVF